MDEVRYASEVAYAVKFLVSLKVKFYFRKIKDRFLANPSVGFADTFPCRDGFERMGIYRVGASEIATLTLAMTTQGYSGVVVQVEVGMLFYRVG